MFRDIRGRHPIRLLLMFEILRLTLAKKRSEWECNKTIISENFSVLPFVKTSGYNLKVFVFKLNQIHICQSIIVEKHLSRYYVRMNSMSKVSKGAKIRNRYNQVPHLTQDTNGKVTNSQ